MFARLDFMLLLFAGGQATFDWILRDEVSVYSWVMLAVSGVVYIFSLLDLLIAKVYDDYSLSEYKELKHRIIDKHHPNEASSDLTHKEKI